MKKKIKPKGKSRWIVAQVELDRLREIAELKRAHRQQRQIRQLAKSLERSVTSADRALQYAISRLAARMGFELVASEQRRTGTE